MEEELRKLIESKFKIHVVEGEDKTCTLEEAMRRLVRPEMAINISTGGALMYQLMREFWGKRPNFTLITPALGSHLLALIQGKLLKKVLTSFAGNGYPSPGPTPIIQKAYLSGEVELENWTMRTIPQRLLAGAMGWGFIPTKSLVESSMPVNGFWLRLCRTMISALNRFFRFKIQGEMAMATFFRQRISLPVPSDPIWRFFFLPI